MSFVAGKPYEGYLWIRADEPAEVHVAAESRDGARVHAEALLTVQGPEWKRYEFTLTPADTRPEPGSIAVTAQTLPDRWSSGTLTSSRDPGADSATCPCAGTWRRASFARG